MAKIVSLGKWKTWVMTVIPYIRDAPILELGHGPGHLQKALAERGCLSIGLDASPYMSRIAQKRLQRSGLVSRIIQGYSEALPFKKHTFPTVVATFPSEYIIQPQTLREIWRILMPGGQVMILPVAWITGKTRLERLAAWLFRITGQSSPEAWQITQEEYYTKLSYISDIGYTYAQHIVELPSSSVLIIILTKPSKY